MNSASSSAISWLQCMRLSAIRGINCSSSSSNIMKSDRRIAVGGSASRTNRLTLGHLAGHDALPEFRINRLKQHVSQLPQPVIARYLLETPSLSRSPSPASKQWARRSKCSGTVTSNYEAYTLMVSEPDSDVSRVCGVMKSTSADVEI